MIEGKRAHLAVHIAREGGKALPGAIVGVHGSGDERRNFVGRDIHMGLSASWPRTRPSITG